MCGVCACAVVSEQCVRCVCWRVCLCMVSGECVWCGVACVVCLWCVCVRGACALCVTRVHCAWRACAVRGAVQTGGAPRTGAPRRARRAGVAAPPVTHARRIAGPAASLRCGFWGVTARTPAWTGAPALRLPRSAALRGSAAPGASQGRAPGRRGRRGPRGNRPGARPGPPLTPTCELTLRVAQHAERPASSQTGARRSEPRSSPTHGSPQNRPRARGTPSHVKCEDEKATEENKAQP